jgi:hypothetical protein
VIIEDRLFPISIIFKMLKLQLMQQVLLLLLLDQLEQLE